MLQFVNWHAFFWCGENSLKIRSIRKIVSRRKIVIEYCNCVGLVEVSILGRVFSEFRIVVAWSQIAAGQGQPCGLAGVPVPDDWATRCLASTLKDKYVIGTNKGPPTSWLLELTVLSAYCCLLGAHCPSAATTRDERKLENNSFQRK